MAPGQRLGDVQAAHLLAVVEIGQGAGHAQHAMPAAGGETQPFGGAGQQRAAFGVGRGDLGQELAVSLRIAGRQGGAVLRDEAGEALVAGPYSLETLLTGSNEYSVLRKTTEGADIRIWRNLADAGRWFTTVLIWGVPALSAVVLAARRHQER